MSPSRHACNIHSIINLRRTSYSVHFRSYLNVTVRTKLLSGRRANGTRTSSSGMACEACSAKFNLFKRKVSDYFLIVQLCFSIIIESVWKDNLTYFDTELHVVWMKEPLFCSSHKYCQSFIYLHLLSC